VTNHDALAPLGDLSAVLTAVNAIVDALDIDPGATRVRVNAVEATGDKRELASVTLAELMVRADFALVQAKAQQSTAPRPLIVAALQGAILALRSYQHGNTAPDLAREMADACEAALAHPEGR
jgi:hypothetical protein